MTTLNPTQVEPKPISDKQRIANLANAQRSTGPKTAEGKARSRRNALKHGLAATLIDAPGLDPADVQARMDEWEKALNPLNDGIEHFFVDLAVGASFRLERCIHAQKQLIANAGRELFEEGEIDDYDKRNSPAEQYKLMMRYEIQTERTLLKLVKDLRARTKIALKEAARPRPQVAQPKPNSAPNEPISAKPAATKVDVPTPKPITIDIFDNPAKSAKPPQTKAERRWAKKYGSDRPR